MEYLIANNQAILREIQLELQLELEELTSQTLRANQRARDIRQLLAALAIELEVLDLALVA